MVKQSKARKPEPVGKGKVTPIQIAFIVDRYLSDNRFTEARTAFRTEASSLIARSPVNEAPKSLLSLGEMLDEYINLKEQKVLLDQEKAHLEKEKLRVHNLLHGMQDVMNSYNSGGGGGGSPSPPTIPSAAGAPQAISPPSLLEPSNGSPPGNPTYMAAAVPSVSLPSSASKEVVNFSTPISCNTSRNKRKSLNASYANVASKRSCSRVKAAKSDSPGQSNTTGCSYKAGSMSESSSLDPIPSGAVVYGSSIAKTLFTRATTSPHTVPSGPKTPPQTSCSQSDKSSSPLEICSSANSEASSRSQDAGSTGCFIISSETRIVSPSKQISHRISYSSPMKTDFKKINKRDHVKGRLDFDVSDSAMTSEKAMPVGNSTSDLFDIDSINFDAFGADFNISELLDLDMDCQGADVSSNPLLHSLVESNPESCHVLRGDNVATIGVSSDFSSTPSSILSERDMNIQGPDSVTSIKTRTCIRLLSPGKTSFALNQENLSITN